MQTIPIIPFSVTQVCKHANWHQKVNGALQIGVYQTKEIFPFCFLFFFNSKVMLSCSCQDQAIALLFSGAEPLMFLDFENILVSNLKVTKRLF